MQYRGCLGSHRDRHRMLETRPRASVAKDAETPAVAAKASVAGAAPPRANVNQAQPQTIHDVMLWLTTSAWASVDGNFK